MCIISCYSTPCTLTESLQPPITTREVRASQEELQRLTIEGGPALASATRSRQPSFMGAVTLLSHYPRAVFFMLGNEFCERFSFYGMRAILTLYLVMEYQMSDSTAK